MNIADRSLWHRMLDARNESANERVLGNLVRTHGEAKTSAAVSSVYQRDPMRSLREKLQLATMGEVQRYTVSPTVREAAQQAARERYYESDANYGGDWPEDH